MDDARTRVAKVLRGTHRAVAWSEASDDCRNLWLARADHVLEAAVEPEKEGRLVEDWKWRVFNSWSSRFVMAVTFIGANALNYLDVIASVMSMLPPELRAFIPIPAMILLFGGYALLKMLKQKQK